VRGGEQAGLVRFDALREGALDVERAGQPVLRRGEAAVEPGEIRVGALRERGGDRRASIRSA